MSNLEYMLKSLMVGRKIYQIIFIIFKSGDRRVWPLADGPDMGRSRETSGGRISRSQVRNQLRGKFDSNLTRILKLNLIS